jgi:hypothetical protein
MKSKNKIYWYRYGFILGGIRCRHCINSFSGAKPEMTRLYTVMLGSSGTGTGTHSFIAQLLILGASGTASLFSPGAKP